jgi:hypothetical protein
LIEGVEVEVEAEEVAEDVGVGQKIMRNRAHTEALLIFYSVSVGGAFQCAGYWWRCWRQHLRGTMVGALSGRRAVAALRGSAVAC